MRKNTLCRLSQTRGTATGVTRMCLAWAWTMLQSRNRARVLLANDVLPRSSEVLLFYLNLYEWVYSVLLSLGQNPWADMVRAAVTTARVEMCI